METSIVMTAYRRAPQLRRTLQSIFAQTDDAEVIVVEDGNDGGATRAVCNNWPVQYFQRVARPAVAYSNQAVPMNVGIRQARGDVLILQNAECLHVTPDMIEQLVAPHRSVANLAVFAAVLRIGQYGAPEEMEPTNLTSPYFFCGSIRREQALRLGGFDERFRGWGADDCDFGNRMRFAGIEFQFRPDLLVHHQWHESVPRYSNGYEANRALMLERLIGMERGVVGFVANEGREWGRLDAC